MRTTSAGLTPDFERSGLTKAPGSPAPGGGSARSQRSAARCRPVRQAYATGSTRSYRFATADDHRIDSRMYQHRSSCTAKAQGFPHKCVASRWKDSTECRPAAIDGHDGGWAWRPRPWVSQRSPCSAAGIWAVPLIEARGNSSSGMAPESAASRLLDTTELQKQLAAKGVSLGAPIMIRIFKEETELEVWVDKGERYERFAIYEICNWSGVLGPQADGGRQAEPRGTLLDRRRSAAPQGPLAALARPRLSQHLRQGAAGAPAPSSSCTAAALRSAASP